MKKLLALVLALVMTLGLATVGTNAALSDFSDASDVNYEDAMAVMNAVGVFVGSDGKLDPKGNLTRAAAAKLIAYLALGESVAESLPKTGSKFADVPNGAWYTGYVNYMLEAGYTTGTGATTFDPNGSLTGYQFGAFLLAVLGYDREAEGMTGSGWETKVAVALQNNGITDGVDKLGSATLTREEAAQFCFNALQADMVYYEGGSNVEVNGVKFSSGSARKVAAAGAYGPYTSTHATAWDAVLGSTRGNLQLGEKLYGGKLVPSEVVSNGEQGYTWMYNGSDTEAFTATSTVLATSTKGTAFTNLITKGKSGYIGYVADTTVAIYLNGTIYDTGADGDIIGTATVETNKAFTIATASKLAALTAYGEAHDAIGTVIEFLDNDNDSKFDAVAITEYTVGKVTATKAATATAEATITVAGMKTNSAVKESAIDGDISGLAKDDYVLFAPVADSTGAVTYKLYKADSFTGKLTKRVSNTWTIDGAAYTASDRDMKGNSGLTATTTAQTINTEATYYTDANGYIVAYGSVKTETKYVAIGDIAWVVGTGIANSSYAEAELIFTDGTHVTGKIKSINGNAPTYNSNTSDFTGGASEVLVATTAAANYAEYTGMVGTYTINDDGEYVITNAVQANSGASDQANITKGSPTVKYGLGGNSTATANANTVYIYKAGTRTSPTYTVYTGYANAPTTSANSTNAYAKIAVAVKSGYAQFVYVHLINDDSTYTANTSATTGHYLMFLNDPTASKNVSAERDAADKNNIFGYSAVLDGVAGTYYTKTNAVSSAKAGVLYAVKVDSDGYFVDAADNNVAFNNATDGDYQRNVAAANANNGTLKVVEKVEHLSGSEYAMTYSSAKAYIVDLDNETVTEGTPADTLSRDEIFVLPDSTTSNDSGARVIKTLYIVRDGNDVATLAAGTTKAEVKVAPDGLYNLEAADQFTDVYSAASTRIFKFTVGQTSGSYTLTIKDSAGTSKYVETHAYNATNNFFYIDLSNNSGNVISSSVTTNAWTSGAVPAGTYTYTIVGSSEGTVLEGSFTV